VIPGLVNTHCHTSQQLGRGLADDVDLLTWLHDRVWPYEVSLTHAESELSALCCAIEQIRNGTTTIADPGGRHVDGMARALERAGIRALLGRSTMDSGDGRPVGDREDTATALAATEDLVGRWHGAAGGRLRMGHTVRTIFNATDELILSCVERAKALGTVVQMHVAEVPEENDHAVATRGTTTVRHLGRIGALGPELLAVHAVWIDDAEIELLARTATPVSHNAASNLRVLGIPRVADLLDAGAVVGLGTDGAPCNNRMSMLDELWLASLVQKGLRRDPTALPAPAAFAMATIGGARALRWDDEIGSLTPGRKADLAVLDPGTPNVVPGHDLASALVTSMNTTNVRHVLCDGRWLLRDRAFVDLDEQAVLAEAVRAGAAIRARLGR